MIDRLNESLAYPSMLAHLNIKKKILKAELFCLFDSIVSLKNLARPHYFLQDQDWGTPEVKITLLRKL